MGSRREIFVLVITDALTICAAWVLYYLVRVRSGWIDVTVEPDLLGPMILIYVFWLLTFLFVGLYRHWYAASRLDEMALVFKTITLGCLFLFFVIFADDQGKNVMVSSRLLIGAYWGILLISVSFGRLAIRSIQRRMLIAGIGTHPTIVVGSAAKAKKLYDDVSKYPALGYRVVGFVHAGKRAFNEYKDVPVLGGADDLHTVIERHHVRDVLIALDSSDHDRLIDIIANCNSLKVNLKIMPDLYDIISGQARTNQIYGFPLIEIMPQLMTPWEESTKRLVDILISSVILLIGLPIWLLVALLIKLESAGPVLYRQERVGKDGVLFHIIKFRSMYINAEAAGPQWSPKRDPRITKVGKILRKLHFDEIPQMINVLRGQMSLVGPRPERPVFVAQLSKDIPLYMRRLKVRPGVTGWAQVKHKYDESVEDVRKKVQYDLFYIENMSFRMDLKIIFSTVFHSLLGRGQ